ncbi:DUF6328 family protein [Microbacterium dextranolyticum]|uniref:Sodium:proton antiporter n=1 Tax=Microbacterium dextranolyticum TaxID=36806 RepID=A0A9W6M6I5_9MICO|nr:DUF6328 family protein [Microbacterium dextranolyticum]MBM7463254.1 putative membrane protein [Microbacterium dextranolyticum]GLJ95640.1 hypothetical protein GCM10017591_17030 [Microbacterium dextranolyticum]
MSSASIGVRAARPVTDADGRDETANERADRNWNEVLQELRVMQTGTQILAGFLLALAFQPAFMDLDARQRAFYLVLVVLATLSAVVALAPVALHRALFARREKQIVVAFGHGALVSSLVTVALLLVGVLAFVVDIVLDARAAWIVGASAATVVAVLWIVIPLILRRRGAAR